MSKDNGCISRNVALGFLAGAAAGAIGALLFAPMPGNILRRELFRERRRMSNRLVETAEDLKDKSSDAYQSAAEVVSGAARSLKQAAESMAR